MDKAILEPHVPAPESFCQNRSGASVTDVTCSGGANFTLWYSGERLRVRGFAGGFTTPRSTTRHKLGIQRCKVRQVATRRFLSEPHDLGAAWAKRHPWRVFIRELVAHRQSPPPR